MFDPHFAHHLTPEHDERKPFRAGLWMRCGYPQRILNLTLASGNLANIKRRGW